MTQPPEFTVVGNGCLTLCVIDGGGRYVLSRSEDLICCRGREAVGYFPPLEFSVLGGRIWGPWDWGPGKAREFDWRIRGARISGVVSWPQCLSRAWHGGAACLVGGSLNDR